MNYATDACGMMYGLKSSIQLGNVIRISAHLQEVCSNFFGKLFREQGIS